MRKYNLLSIILLGITIISCNGCKKNSENYFRFDEAKFKPKYTQDDVVSLEVTNKENRTIDSVAYFANDVRIGSSIGTQVVKFPLQNQKLGYHNLKAKVYFDGDATAAETSARIELVSNITPKAFKYTIVNTFPHDTTSFTEGLEFFRDTLYEGTGLRGKSMVLKTDYKTGKIIKSLPLDAQYFGEGITFINNKLYQLTWEENVGFIYNADTWKLEKTFTYDKKIEGWGMTNDGKNIYHGDGTEKIWKMDPNTQKMIDYVNVYVSSNKIKQVNELEYIEGKIYVNVWQKDAVAIINPETGAVDAILDLSGLRALVKNKTAEVLNGIAYNPKTKTVFITGKNWAKMFEIKISE